MADILTTDRYDRLPSINRWDSLAGIKATKSYQDGDSLKALFTDTFYAIRGQKRNITNQQIHNTGLRNDGKNYFIPYWEKTNGDIIGMLDYAMLLLPCALKLASAALVIGAIEYVTTTPKKAYEKGLQALFGIFLLVPSIVLGLALSMVSWLVDQVKNLIALTITSAMLLPVLVPLASRKNKANHKAKMQPHTTARTSSQLSGKYSKFLEDSETDSVDDSSDEFDQLANSPSDSPGRSPRFGFNLKFGRK